jgi:hypothetical protein
MAADLGGTKYQKVTVAPQVVAKKANSDLSQNFIVKKCRI